MADHPAKQTVRLTLDDLATIGAMYEETEDLNIAAAVAAALAAVRTTTREVLTVGRGG